jgi:hypothetical protein
MEDYKLRDSHVSHTLTGLVVELEHLKIKKDELFIMNR